MTHTETNLLELLRGKSSNTSSGTCEYLHFTNGEFTIRKDGTFMFEWYDDEDDDDDDSDCIYSSSWISTWEDFKLVGYDDHSIIIKFGDTKFEFLIPPWRNNG